MSLLVNAFMLAFTCYRLMLLVTYGDTNVTVDVVEDYYSGNYTFDFEKNNFKIAFGLVSHEGLGSKLNLDIIDYQVYLN